MIFLSTTKVCARRHLFFHNWLKSPRWASVVRPLTAVQRRCVNRKQLWLLRASAVRLWNGLYPSSWQIIWQSSTIILKVLRKKGSNLKTVISLQQTVISSLLICSETLPYLCSQCTTMDFFFWGGESKFSLWLVKLFMCAHARFGIVSHPAPSDNIKSFFMMLIGIR